MNKLKQFYEKVHENLKNKLKTKTEKVGSNVMENKYWNQILLLQAQTEGLLIGFNAKNETKMTMGDIYLLNGDGEISELLSLIKSPNYFGENGNYRYKITKNHLQKKYDNIKPFVKKLFKKFKTKNREKIWKLIEIESHCSAFIKIIKDNNNKIQDVLVSHSTWDHYSEMLRIYKKLFHLLRFVDVISY